MSALTDEERAEAQRVGRRAWALTKRPAKKTLWAAAEALPDEGPREAFFLRALYAYKIRRAEKLKLLDQTDPTMEEAEDAGG